MPASTPAPDQPAISQPVARLEETIHALTAAHDRLAESGVRREEAVRNADHRGLAACVQEAATIVQRIAELDRQRAEAVGALRRDVGAPERGEPTVSWIAARLPAPARERLLAAAESLRRSIEMVRERSAADRLALETLAAHMAGLLRQAQEAFSHSGAYGRKGAVAAGPAVVTALDLTS